MITALGFLTIIGRGGPAGGGVPTTRALPFFPVVGALIGLAVGGVWWGAGQLWPPLVAAALAVTADVLITGILHLDGLSDAADGLIAPLDRERRLAVMRDPAVGAFGVVTLVVVLLLRAAVFASIPAAPWMVAALWCLSRMVMAVVLTTARYARGDGLASVFAGGGARWALPAVIGVAIAVPLAVVERGATGLIPLGAALLAAGLVTLFTRRRIGGFTGDTLGATGVLAETAGLIGLAAL